MIARRTLLLFTTVIAAVGIIGGIGSCSNDDPDDGALIDSNPPIITIEGDNPDTITTGTIYHDEDFSAEDEEDGDLTNYVEVHYGDFDTSGAEAGTYTIMYTVRDAFGNSDTATRKVVVIHANIAATDTITNTSLESCPVTFDDTNVIYIIPSTLEIESGCTVTFGAKTTYQVKGNITINDNGTLIIREGAELSFAENRYISIAENSAGTFKALGTETDSIRFSNLTEGKYWGYASSATSSGGFWFDDDATSACSLMFCVIDSAATGLYVNDAAVAISHCRISHNKWYGINFVDDGMPADSARFIDNIVTDNGAYGIAVNANHLGSLSGTGSFIDNANGGILVNQDEVTDDAIWKKHDAPYVVDGAVNIGSESDVTVTIRPGCEFELKEDAYISVGESHTGTLNADGTESDSIRFTNYSEGTVWGYASSASSSGGIWIGANATANCSFSYCLIDSATTGMYIDDASVAISHCRITNATWYGIHCYDDGTPADSAEFIDNVITGNGEYGLAINANHLGSLSGTGSFIDNANGGILVNQDEVTDDAIWKKHDAPYVVDGAVNIGSESDVTVTIRPGCEFELKEDAYISVGESHTGTLNADGTESDSIRFTNYSEGTVWGYASSASSSGGIWIGANATANCSFSYCLIDSATTGMYIDDATVAISHCRITNATWYGIHCYDDGTPADSAEFIDNVITGNGEYGLAINANHLGSLSGTGSFIDNANGGILVNQDEVTDDAIWKKHDAPYVVDGAVNIGSESDVTVTIRPGCEFELKEDAYISVGESYTATLIAEGTAEDSIKFSNYSSGTKWGYSSSATSSGGIWIDAHSTNNTSLKICSITEASTGIYISDSAPTIENCSISNCEYYGIFLYNASGANISNIDYSDNGAGDLGSN